MSNKIQAIKALFKNIRETLSREEINEVGTKYTEIQNFMNTMLIKQN